MKKIAIITGIFTFIFIGCKTSSDTSSSSGNISTTEVAKDDDNNKKPQPSETSPKKPTTMKSLRSAPKAVE